MVFKEVPLRKLEPVIHDISVVNFPFIWTRIKRYKSYLLLLPFIMAGIGFFLFKTQFVIYRQYLPIKVASEVLKGELSRSQLQLNFNELLATTGSYEFHSLLAKQIVANPRFKEMNFTPLKANSLNSWQDVFGTCRGAVDCETKRLSGFISQFISVEKGTSDERYTFILTSLDAETLKILTPIFIDTVGMFRVQSIQTSYQKHEELLKDMLKKTQHEFTQEENIDSLNKFKINELRLHDLKEDIHSLQKTINDDTSKLTSVELHLKEAQSLTRDLNVSTREKLKSEELRMKLAKMNELRTNIAALKSLDSKSRSSSDEVFLKHIQRELELTEKEVSMSSRRTVRISEGENFNSAQQSNKSSLNFQYNILKKKIEKEKAKIDILMSEASFLINSNSILEAKTVGLAQEMETIKELSSRLHTIRLMNSTIKSDIYFEDFADNLDEFHRSSPTKNFLFSFIISLLIISIVLAVRYFSDDQLIGEYEIKKCFNDLTIIGKAPEFD